MLLALSDVTDLTHLGYTSILLKNYNAKPAKCVL